MESLLSPSESHTFQSFLSSISDTSHDWNVDIDVPKDKTALAKATKDLMSLDQSYWQSNPPSTNHHPYLAHQHQDLLPFLNRHSSLLQPSHLFLPPPPPSDSSSRTPTPTSASPFTFAPSAQIARSLDSSSIGKQTKRPRHSHPHPYELPPSSPQSQSIPRLRRSHSNAYQLPQPQPPVSASSTPSPLIKPPPKPALLTASQKKANHIQSEQKRRANIRRGYDALCDCVPALCEAIREEEEAAAAERSDSVGVPGQQGKLRKGKAAMKGRDGEERVDGRAGPRSENIVLSKSRFSFNLPSCFYYPTFPERSPSYTAIEYINELLDERSALLARLHRARTTLPPGHPALIVPPRKRSGQDTNSIPSGQEEEDGPLWEREWQGGLGKLGDMGDDAAMDEGDDSS